MKPYLLNWQTTITVDEDIGGSMFDTCSYCGGKKEYEKGMDDYGDNTHQCITCTFCGWYGSRKIKYSSDRWANSVSTTYVKSVLLESKQIDMEEVVDTYTLKISMFKYLIFYKDKTNNIKILYAKYILNVTSIKLFESIEINWDEKIVTFSFSDLEAFDLHFDKAMELLGFLNLINYDLVNDYDILSENILKEENIT